MKLRLHFRLRTLLLLTALIAGACYWCISLPTRVANRFADAVMSKEYSVASSLVADDRQSRQFTGLYFAVLAAYQEAEADYPTPEVAILPLTLHDIVHRERRIEIRSRTSSDSTLATVGVAPTHFVVPLFVHDGAIEYRRSIIWSDM